MTEAENTKETTAGATSVQTADAKPAATSTPANAKAEVAKEAGEKVVEGGEKAAHWYELNVKQILLHLLFAVAVGVVTGFASVILCICIDWSYKLFTAAPWLLWVLPVMGILQLLLYHVFKLPGDLTTHRVVDRIRKDENVSPTLAPGILIATCMSILCGGSVGKEAGALQMGASLGSLVSRPFKLRSVYKRNAKESMDGYAAATGMASCFSALFFAPIGAMFFVLELSHFNKAVLRHAGTILIACFVAFLISSTIGIGDIINKVDLPAFDWHVVGQVAVIGLAAAFAGTIFDSVIKWVHDITWRITHNLYVWVVVGGLLFAVLVTAFGWMHFTGSGGNNLNDALAGHFGPWDFAIKMLLTCVCLSLWLKGGEIMPSFCIGGLLGASCTYLTGGSPELGAAVGCMSFLAAFSRCPLAAFFMGCEIFGWAAAPFLAIGVVIAILCGSPVGMYGDGVDRALRTRWHSYSENVRKQRFQESSEKYNYVGALQKVSTVGDALKETFDSTENKTPHPD